MINLTRLFSMLIAAIASPNKQVAPTCYKRNLPVALILGGMLGFSATSAWGWGATTTTSSYSSGWGSRLECPYGGLPGNVADAVDDDATGTYPAGASGIRFAISLDCTEQDGTLCETHSGENGIRTILDGGSTGGFQISAGDNSITRTDGGSFIADGFTPGMIIGIRTENNGPSGADLNEFTIASDSGAVTGTRIEIAEGTLNEEGTGDTAAPGKIFSSRVNVLTSGPAGCYVTDDDGNFIVESPLPVDQANINIDYQNVIRECDETLLTCNWTALVTDTSHSIDGYVKLDDGKQLVNHDCVAGQPCTTCVRNPDTLKKKTLEHYAATGFFNTLESVHATENAAATPPVVFDGRYPSSGAEIGDETVCLTATVAFAEQGKDRDAAESIEGVIQISGKFESETLNIASKSGTTKYTFSPGSEVTCNDIDPDSVRLENTLPIPGSELEILGNGDCRSQFDKGELIANIRAANPGITDGDTYTLVAKGEYDENNIDGYTAPSFCTTGSCAPFESRDTVTITEQFNETIQFSTASSGILEPTSGTSTHSVTVRVAGGSLNGVATVEVVDTLNGSANKRDYEFTSKTLVFDPSDSGSLSQTVNITILANSPNNEVDTVILKLVNISGPASLGEITQHTVTISD